MIRTASHNLRVTPFVPVCFILVFLLSLGGAFLVTEPAAAQVVQLQPQSWGLDRIDQHAAALDGQYRYAATGAGVHVFVVDSGIRSTHADLAGRVDTVDAFTTIQDGLGTEDCTGHGTAVAGVVAGWLSGVAKGATLHPVRVQGCSGDPTSADLVAAIDWATATYLAHQKGKPANRWRAVGLLSVTRPQAMATVPLNQALYRSIAAGMTWVAPAGDWSVDACGILQPVLGLPDVIVVGATGRGDLPAPFSNTGACVDLVAPGVDLILPSAAGDTAMARADGTALAAAHVAGTAALLLESSPDASPGQIERVLGAWGTDTSAGRLVYSFFAGDGVDEPPVPSMVFTCRMAQRACTFDASGSFDDGEIVSYTWDFGDGETTSHAGDSTRHKYFLDGDLFDGTLTVTDDAGQSATVPFEAVLALQP